MDRERLQISPDDWLSAEPAPLSPGYRSKTLASFSRPPSVFRFRGPAELIRATGKDDEGVQARAYGGGYWVEKSVVATIDATLTQYTGWLYTAEIARMARGRYRAGTAICENWNDLSEFHKMVVPDGDTFEGLCGPVAPQPLREGMDRSLPTTPMLRGGFEQIFLKVRNPFWIFLDCPL